MRVVVLSYLPKYQVKGITAFIPVFPVSIIIMNVSKIKNSKVLDYIVIPHPKRWLSPKFWKRIVFLTWWVNDQYMYLDM